MNKKCNIPELVNKAPLVQFIQTHLSITATKAGEIADRFTEKAVAKDNILFEEGKVCNGIPNVLNIFVAVSSAQSSN